MVRGREAALTVLALAACARPPPFEDFDLCLPGEVADDAALIPAPWRIHRLGAPHPIAPGVAGDHPAMAIFAEEARTVVMDADRAGLVIEVADPPTVCGEPLPGDEEAYALITSGSKATIAAHTERGASRALATLLQLMGPGPTLRDARIVDRPLQPRRGVLEGFYGTPWSEEERREMLRFTWRMRMNTLGWAPKDEHASRLLWRFDYPEETLRHLRALAKEAKALGVDFCPELSPGIGLLHGDPAERARIRAKLDVLAGTGAPCAALAFDDIPRDLRPEDAARYPGGIGEAQADLLREVVPAFLAAHPGVSFGFVPVDYWTEAIEAHPEYTRAVAAALPREVWIGWTGPRIVSSTVTFEHVARATEWWGRSPFMGDNYPVADGERDRGRLQMGPVRRRDPGAVGVTAGWIANAMVLPRASQVPLATVADMTWSASYVPEDAWARAIARIGGDAAAGLSALASVSRGGLEPEDAPELARMADAWIAAYPADHPGLRAELARIAAIAPSVPEPLATEVRPWLEALTRHAKACTEAMDLAAVPDPTRRAALEQEAAALRRSRVEVLGGASLRILERALR